MMKKIIVIPFAFFLYCSLYAQESTVKQTLTSIKNQIITNKYSPVDENSLYKEGNGFFVLNNLASWYADSTYAIRSRAVIITGRLGSFTESEEVRSLAIDKLFALCTDNNVSVVKNAAGYLKTIPWKSFNTGQKNSLKQFLKPGQPALEDFIYLTGYTYSKNYIDDLNALLISDKISNAEKWQIYASLARLGMKRAFQLAVKWRKKTLWTTII